MKVGVIGAGTMGSGIAQAFAQTEGYEVYLCDINDDSFQRTDFFDTLIIFYRHGAGGWNKIGTFL